MATIRHDILIDAPLEDVFDIIARVEGFKNYSKLIRDIKEVSPRRYFWKIEYLGIGFEWEAEVIEFERPRRFAWRSVSGTYNAGSYTLESTEGGNGTKVSFEIEFHLHSHFIDALASPFMSHAMDTVATEMLDNIKRELNSKG